MLFYNDSRIFNCLYRIWYFRESIFALSDGFNEQDLEEYRNVVLEVDDVKDVNNLKGRYHGSIFFRCYDCC